MKINTCATESILRLSHLTIIVNEEAFNCISLSAIKVNTENYRLTVVCSSIHQNAKCGNFTLLFCRGRHGLVHNSVSHVQHDYFPHSTNQILNLWRCRCRSRRWCQSSQISPAIINSSPQQKWETSTRKLHLPAALETKKKIDRITSQLNSTQL